MTQSDPWLDVREFMRGQQSGHVRFGGHISYWLRNSPRRLLHAMAYYKFAARMIGPDAHVLDLGCAEGLGTWLLARECGRAMGIDFDEQAVADACHNWRTPNIDFQCRDFFGFIPETPFDAMVSFDVIEHIPVSRVEEFLGRLSRIIRPYGVAIVGTPSLEGQQYASEISRRGHINVYDGERLERELRQHFRQVFLFSANDEMVHTGFRPMAQYLIAVACGNKENLIP